MHEDIRTIYLAGGCFWGIEAHMEKIYGVKEANLRICQW